MTDQPQTPATYWAEMIRADLARRRAEAERPTPTDATEENDRD